MGLPCLCRSGGGRVGTSLSSAGIKGAKGAESSHEAKSTARLRTWEGLLGKPDSGSDVRARKTQGNEASSEAQHQREAGTTPGRRYN